MVNPYARQYAKVQANTVSQEQLLIMLYEGAVRFLGQAREELGEGRLSTGKTALSKGMAIVAELQNSLDRESGWDGAENLFDLYDYMMRALTEANISGNLECIDEVRTMMVDLCDTWRKAIDSKANMAFVSKPSQVAVAQGAYKHSV
jgi:flagellar protein FliS